MNKIDKQKVIDALSKVLVPESDSNVVELGMIGSIIIKNDNDVGFAIEITPENISRENAEKLRKECELKVSSIENVNRVTAVLTSQSNNPTTSKSGSSDKPNLPQKNSMSEIKNIIVVASGKGGVGKSTVAVNLAVALGRKNYKVGLVDADILGPSITRMMGVKGKPESQGNFMIPMENHGIKCLSIGSLIDEDAPIVWRGPMVSKALHQLTYGALWGKLDYLVIDLPPGTGDIQISLSKNYPISGAVIVTTPQEVALMDVKKAIGMFQKMNIPIIGVVENMSYFEDPETGKKNYIFGDGNVEKMASKFGLRILSKIPLSNNISLCGDKGNPLGLAHEQLKIFADLSYNVAAIAK